MFPGFKVAIIDDEKDIRESISQWLTLTGYETDVFPDADSALKIIGNGYPGVVISDIRMPGLDGMELLQRLTRCRPRNSSDLNYGSRRCTHGRSRNADWSI